MAKQALRARPFVASYIMLLGSFIIFLGGVLPMLLPRYTAPIVSALSSALGIPLLVVPAGFLGILFAFGIAFCALKTDVKEPWDVRKWSMFAVVLAIMSLIDYGGFGIGFVLAFAGGIMALTYNN